MKKLVSVSILFATLFLLFGSSTVGAQEQRIYDDADLLTAKQVEALESQAEAYFDEWQTDFIIITTKDADDLDIMVYMQNFAKELAEKYNRKEDNMAVFAIDMKTRDFYLGGYGLGEEYLDNERLDMLNQRVTPYLVEGNYYGAFETFFEKSDEYLGVRPGVNPESIFLNTFFQLAVAVGLGGIIVFIMAYNSGGRVTVTSGTYMDHNNSKIVQKRDSYLRKTVTKRKKPSNNNSGGGGGFGGGGGSSGGRSHSGSRGSF